MNEVMYFEHTVILFSQFKSMSSFDGLFAYQ